MSLKLLCEGVFSKLSQLSLKNVNGFHTSAIAAGKINRMKDRKSMLKTVGKKTDGTEGADVADIDSISPGFVISTKFNRGNHKEIHSKNWYSLSFQSSVSTLS